MGTIEATVVFTVKSPLISQEQRLPVSALVRAAFVCVSERQACDGLHTVQSGRQHNTSSSLLSPPAFLALAILSRFVSSHRGLVATRHSSVC